MNQENHLGDKSEGFSPFKFFVIFFIFLILLNLIYIDILTFKGPKSDIISVTPPIQKPIQRESDVCPQSCVSQIHEATASYKPPIQSSTAVSKETPASRGVKEFSISFGPGSNSSSDWQDVSGLQVYIDSSNYPDIKTVTFEAYVRIPTGNQTAYVRLFNKTDKHPVWFSEVSVTGGTPALLISEPITFDQGNKLYQVQMKTQLQFQAILDQARIHIITK